MEETLEREGKAGSQHPPEISGPLKGLRVLDLGLAREFDVVLENYRPGTMESWNLSYEELKKQREDIILVRVSGFG